MTATDLTTVADRASLAGVIGDTAAALIPAEAGWTVVEPTPDSALPEGPLVAVGARAGDHVISIVLTEAMSQRVLSGPPPAESIADGLAATISAIASVMGVGPLDEVAELDPIAVAEETPDHALLSSLFDGDALSLTVIVTPPAPSTAPPSAASFEPIAVAGSAHGNAGLEVLHDVQMGVTAELGRTRMPLRDILSLAPGSVIELDRNASAPVDVMVNGTLVAKGEVVVIDEEFGIRITEIVGYEPPRAARAHDQGGNLR